MSSTQASPLGAAGMTVKAIGWSFFVGSVSSAGGTLASSFGLVSRICVPREVFPLSAALIQAFHAPIGSTGMSCYYFS